MSSYRDSDAVRGIPVRKGGEDVNSPEPFRRKAVGGDAKLAFAAAAGEIFRDAECTAAVADARADATPSDAAAWRSRATAGGSTFGTRPIGLCTPYGVSRS